jgi:G3E family GTPase
MVHAFTHVPCCVSQVDASKFLQEWESTNKLEERPDLGYDAAADLGDGGDGSDVANGSRKIVELLVGQVEIADVVVLNKCDQLADGQLPVLTQVIGALNCSATILPVEFGRIDLTAVLRRIGGGVSTIADNFADDEHRATVNQIRKQKAAAAAQGEGEAAEHGHGHGHATAAAAAAADASKDSEDGGHGHGHGHRSSGAQGAHGSHGHGHGHGHGGDTAARPKPAHQKYGIESFVCACAVCSACV